MAYKLTAEQREKIQNLDADKRYDHFIDKVSKWEEIWSLRDDEGFVLVSTDDEECMPVWPHPDYAAEWATGGWADCEPFKVDIESWLDRWLPGMEEDGISVAVFPNMEESGVVESPRQLGSDLLQAIEG